MKTLSVSLLAASLDLVLFAGLAWMAARLLGRRLPRVTALLWVLVMVRALAGLAAGPTFPLELRSLDLPGSRTPVLQKEVEVQIDSALMPALRMAEAATSSPPPDRTGLLLGLAWAAGMAGFGLFGLRDRLRLRRIVADALPAAAHLQDRLAAAAVRLGVRRPPALLVTDALESPALAGTVAPVILLPRWLAEEGSREQLDWALGHEVMHRKMRDHLTGAVRHLFQIVFFFHPLAWWVGSKWEEAAELACDRALVRNEEEAASYAERLYEMLVKARGRRRTALAAGLFATRTQIGRRIAALLKDPIVPVRLRPAGVLVLALFALLSASMGFGGTGKRSSEASELTADLQLSDDDWVATFHAKGSMDFADDGSDVLEILPGGYVTLSETRDGVTRKLEVRPGADGRLERTYRLDGRRREYDREAQDWVAQTLPRFLRIVAGKHRLMS